MAFSANPSTLSLAGIAVGEAVRHREVQRIRGPEAAPVRGTRRAREQAIVAREHSAASAPKGDLEGSFGRAGRDQEVDEEVVRVSRADDAAQRDARVGDGRLEGRDALAVHEELQPRVLHARPPVRGLDTLDLLAGRGRGCEAKREGEQEAKHAGQPPTTIQIMRALPRRYEGSRRMRRTPALPPRPARVSTARIRAR